MSQFKFNGVRERDGALSSRNSPIKKVTDLPFAVIPVPIHKKKVKVDTSHLSRPVTSYNNDKGHQAECFRPSTEQDTPNQNLKNALNLDKLRLKLNISEKCQVN